ncbi:hypothetical protein EVAR_103302_1 [Eumeta japonica]|uniref:Uncharacterized protein n=1 Tax=Eumeta variegata TaxID=151549 RepID=A0A4C1XQI5_EUMVA|nr:hypothetical protein EVAR_103302_1 [Eumeta japonica]
MGERTDHDGSGDIYAEDDSPQASSQCNRRRHSTYVASGRARETIIVSTCLMTRRLTTHSTTSFQGFWWVSVTLPTRPRRVQDRHFCLLLVARNKKTLGRATW